MEEKLKTAASFSTRHESNYFSSGSFLGFVETVWEPVIWVFYLWFVAGFYDKGLNGAYLILSIIVFSITFPAEPRLNSSWRQLVVDVFWGWGWVVFLLMLTGFATGYWKYFSAEAISVWLFTSPIILIAGQFVLRIATPLVLELQGPTRKAIVVGMNEQGVALVKKMNQARFSGTRFVGFFDDRSLDRLNGVGEYAFLGRLSQLPEYIKTHDIQIIYLSLPMASQPRILQILDDLKDTTASIFFVPDMFVTDLIQGRSGTVCGMPVISVCETPFIGVNGFVKRMSDIVLAVLILLLISPLLLLVGILVKITSPGPILFRQRRYGLDGKEIIVYKFRSMTVTEDGDSVKQAEKNDVRITPLGKFIRKTSIDELPQFINVLQGRMSIVGPRPHAVAHNELYRKLIKGYMVRHKVKPGITGWAQVNGYRGETETLEKMQGRIDYDLDYLRNWSLRLDIYIIFRTVKQVLHDSQAY